CIHVSPFLVSFYASQSPGEFQPVPDDFDIPPLCRYAGLRFLLKSMKDVNRILNLRGINRAVGSTRIVRSHFPGAVLRFRASCRSELGRVRNLSDAARRSGNTSMWLEYRPTIPAAWVDWAHSQ